MVLEGVVSVSYGQVSVSEAETPSLSIMALVMYLHAISLNTNDPIKDINKTATGKA